MPFNRPTWILVGLIVVMAVGVIVYLEQPQQHAAAPAGTPPPVQVLQVPDAVDGEPESTGAAARRPLAMMIDNFPQARPQWGLSAASRVYEAITEGGITRYMAVFSGEDADRVGPVRSARTQFVDYALELNAAYGHVGGNADALSLIAHVPVKDLNEFRYADAYRRIPAPRVAFEHTMYTSTQTLRSLIEQQGRDEDVSVSRQTWKDDAPPGQRPTAQRLTIDFSSPEYAVGWDYRPATDDYSRTLAGIPDVDARAGQVLTAKTIVIIVVPRTEGRTTIGEDTWTFADLGTGPAWVVQDGVALQGTWEKASRTERLRIIDGTGREVAFNRGPQWVEIIPPNVAPSFAP